MSHYRTPRREFIKNSFVLSSLLLLPEFSAHRDTVTQPKILIRKNIASMSPDAPDIKAYMEAVKKMKKLPESDPRNWKNQASIHSNFCPHQNWYFLPWHRAYLHYFESICRELSGYKDFSLPYWNWTDSRSIPSHFWGSSDNSLFNERRATSASKADANDEFVAQSIIDRILKINDFEVFASSKATEQRDGSAYGELEGTPHNYIHNFVGKDMVTMLSPLDPLFWCHHANIDRIWAHWNDLGHQNSNDPSWLSHEFSEFHGTPKKIQVNQLLDTNKLNYRYDSQKKQLSPQTIISSFNFIDNAQKFETLNTKMASVNSPLSVGIDVNDSFFNTAKAIATENRENSRGLTEEINLIIDEIKIPKSESILVRVFINCDYLNKDTPVTDPHYVGSFTFFATNHSNHSTHDLTNVDKTLTYKFRLTNTLTKLLNEGKFPSGEIKTQLLTLPLFGETSEPGVLSSNFRVEVTKK